MSLDHDDAYVPLAGPGGWPAPVGDAVGGALDRLGALEDEAPAWNGMVRRGMTLAAAYWSGAQAGLYEADESLAAALLAGIASADSCGSVAGPHVVANHAVLVIAGDPVSPHPATEAWIRRVHAVACAPQVTHPVEGDHGVHDHVLAHGDYKHHPNHVRSASGGWLVFAPVDRVAAEMAALAAALGSDAFAGLDPVTRSAYALHAVTHVRPFAAGNGRVGRALASAPLLSAAGIPFAVPPSSAGGCRHALGAAGEGEPAELVDFVAQQCGALVDRADQARREAGSAAGSAATQRWDDRERTSRRLQPLVAEAAEAALDRHRRRTDLGWMADLAEARVVGPPAHQGAARVDAGPVTISAGSGGVGEMLDVSVHPVTGPDDVVLLRAVEAECRLDVRSADVATPVPPAFTARLDALLDRAVTALAVRAAAATDG